MYYTYQVCMYVCIYFIMFQPQALRMFVLCLYYTLTQSHSLLSEMPCHSCCHGNDYGKYYTDEHLIGSFLQNSTPLSTYIYYMFLTLFVYCCVMYDVSIIIMWYAWKSESPTLCHFLPLKKYWSLIGHCGSFFS